jgi:hypothetical protein
MNLSYSWEKFTAAVSCLAESSDSIQNRLINCCLHLSRLDVEDMPEKLKTDFGEIKKEFTKVESAQEGSITASIRVMSDEKAVELARKIVSMNNTIILMYGATEEGQDFA